MHIILKSQFASYLSQLYEKAHSKPWQGPYTCCEGTPPASEAKYCSLTLLFIGTAAGVFPVPDFPPSAGLYKELFIVMINNDQCN